MYVDELGGSKGEMDSDAKGVVITKGCLRMSTSAALKSCVFEDGRKSVAGDKRYLK